MFRRLFLWMVFPSEKAIVRWERARSRGFFRFVLVIGAQWLALFLVLMTALELVFPIGSIDLLASSVAQSPVKIIGQFLIIGFGFGFFVAVGNEFAYRIAK